MHNFQCFCLHLYCWEALLWDQTHLLILPIEGALISALTSSPPLYRVCPTGPNPTRLLPPNTESAREGLALGGVVSEARHSADALQVSLERVGGWERDAAFPSTANVFMQIFWGIIADKLIFLSDFRSLVCHNESWSTGERVREERQSVRPNAAPWRSVWGDRDDAS